MKLARLGALALIVPAAASAQSMNAEQFQHRATVLRGKGMMAMFSMGEIMGSAAGSC